MAAIGTETTRRLDALVVGAGFGGIYMLHKLRNDLGLDAVAIDKAGGVGGTWYWNKYPGALSDSESFVYQYSFDRDLYAQTPWKTKFVAPARDPRVPQRRRRPLRPARTHPPGDRDDRRRRSTRSPASGPFTPTAASPSNAASSSTGLGLLSATNVPDFPGMDDFEGRLVHTGAWPEDLDLTGKRVGVIGNGSTGNQVITATAPIAGHLTSFQRTPQYSVPAGNRELTPEELQSHRDDFDANWDQVRNSSVAMGFEESTVKTFSVSAEERERIFERAWNKGGGFRFMFETFCDIATDEAANEEAASFIRRKIAEIVKDPETRRKLTPTDLYARRPLCDSGYYETFNRPNVSMVNLKETPITHLTEKGIVTADGTLHELDVLDLRHRLRRRRRQLQPRRHPRPRRARACEITGRDGPDQLPRRGHHRLPEHVHDPGPERTVHQPAADDRDPGRVDRRSHPARLGAPTPAGSTSSPRSRPRGPTPARTSPTRRSSRRPRRGSSAPTSPARSGR